MLLTVGILIGAAMFVAAAALGGRHALWIPMVVLNAAAVAQLLG